MCRVHALSWAEIKKPKRAQQQSWPTPYFQTRPPFIMPSCAILPRILTATDKATSMRLSLSFYSLVPSRERSGWRIWRISSTGIVLVGPSAS